MSAHAERKITNQICDTAVTSECYASLMSLPAPNRLRACEIEFGAGGQRLGCKFKLDDGSLLFVNESEITAEIETLIASLGPQTERLSDGRPFVMPKI